MMTLTKLRHTLNRGVDPKALRGVQKIGAGGQRTAFRIGEYVVKANTPAWNAHDYFDERTARSRSRSKVPKAWRRVPRAALRAAGVSAPACWYAGPKRQWVVMPYYAPVAPLINDHEGAALYQDVQAATDRLSRWQVAPGVEIMLDIHEQNLGLHPKTGALVAFDW